ncbi:hypothetical protein E3N88_32948 [Mikania micrantha]|uniref:Uncharacterized protein n=1 Tax=Mikania micrantha TaxID=192012 RepID=A0A5N6MCJ0_9ASTR|nr:hypothetical protein E3N88_32948 [Mikania micrantha]
MSAVCGPYLQTSFAKEVDQTFARRDFEGVCFSKTTSNKENLFSLPQPHCQPSHHRPPLSSSPIVLLHLPLSHYRPPLSPSNPCRRSKEPEAEEEEETATRVSIVSPFLRNQGLATRAVEEETATVEEETATWAVEEGDGGGDWWRRAAAVESSR